jgi:hypothetical protein
MPPGLAGEATSSFSTRLPVGFGISTKPLAVGHLSQRLGPVLSLSSKDQAVGDINLPPRPTFEAVLRLIGIAEDLERRFKEKDQDLRETESEVRNLEDLLEMERTNIRALQREFATWVLAALPRMEIADPEVTQLVTLFRGCPIAPCSSCKKRAPLKLQGDQMICAWGCSPKEAS